MHRISLKPIMVLIVLAGLIQAASFDYIRLFGVKPDLLLAITVFAALSFNRTDVLKCAAAAGIIKDITSSSIFGSYTLMFFIIGLLIGMHQNKFYRQMPLTQVFLSFSAYMFMGACALLLNSIAYKQIDFFYNGIGLVVKGSIYTGLTAPLVFLIASKILRIKLAQAF